METVKRIVTDSGFIAEFWDRLRLYRQAIPTTTHRAVFEELNALFEAEYGEPKYKSFDAFRKRRDGRRKPK